MAKQKARGGLAPNKYLSDVQLKKLRQYVKDMADLARQRGSLRAIIDELIVEILANTGLRASELCQLNIEDLPVSRNKSAFQAGNKCLRDRPLSLPMQLPPLQTAKPYMPDSSCELLHLRAPVTWH